MPNKTSRLGSTNTLFQFTIKEIHTAIIKSAGDKRKLAEWLRTRDKITLPTHLGKFLFGGLPLTLERLNQLSIDDASTQMGEYYDVLLPKLQPKAGLYPMSYLHQVCCAASSIRSAAILLGIRDHTLERHLSDMSYEVNGAPFAITFDFFRTLSHEEVKAHCSDKMTVKLTNVNLPHERFNLTPNIPENNQGLSSIGNPLSLHSSFKRLSSVTRSAPDILSSSSDEELTSPTAFSSKKRKIAATDGTTDALLNVGPLTGLSMFSPGKKYAFRIRKKRVDDPDFVYPELRASNRCAKPSRPIARDDNLLTLWDDITIHSQCQGLGDDLFSEEGYLLEPLLEDPFELDLEDDDDLLDPVGLALW